MAVKAGGAGAGVGTRQERDRADDIAAAWDEAGGGDEHEEGIVSAREDSDTSRVDDQEVDEVEAGEDQGDDEGGSLRDEHGRFAKKDGEEEGQGAEGEEQQEGEEQPAAEGAGEAAAEGDPAAVAAAAGAGDPGAGGAPTQGFKPPDSWRPLERDALSKIPGKEGEMVRAAVTRREAQMRDFVRDTEGFRRFASDFYSVVQPHQQLMSMLQTTPLRAVHALMGTASVLYLGPPQMKAKAVAELIQQHRIDPAAIADFLDGVAPQGGAAAAAADPRIDQLVGTVQRLTGIVETTNQRIEREAQEAADSHVTQWAKDKPWFSDVRERMSKLAAADESLTLDQLYATAVSMDPQISKLDAQRKEAERVKKKAQKAAQDRRAASSPRPNPTVRAKGQPTGERSRDIESAWDEVEGRVA